MTMRGYVQQQPPPVACFLTGPTRSRGDSLVFALRPGSNTHGRTGEARRGGRNDRTVKTMVDVPRALCQAVSPRDLVVGRTWSAPSCGSWMSPGLECRAISVTTFIYCRFLFDDAGSGLCLPRRRGRPPSPSAHARPLSLRSTSLACLSTDWPGKACAGILETYVDTERPPRETRAACRALGTPMRWPAALALAVVVSTPARRLRTHKVPPVIEPTPSARCARFRWCLVALDGGLRRRN